jgi:hypothetical protein
MGSPAVSFKKGRLPAKDRYLAAILESERASQQASDVASQQRRSN